MIGREKITWSRVHHAEQIIAALGTAAKSKNGMFTYDLPGSPQMRPVVARILREMGVPLMARRSGRQSVWFILSLHSKRVQQVMGEEWRRRIIADGYAEICRMHMAVAPHPYMAEEERILAAIAVQLGERLGYGIAEVQSDMATRAIHPKIDAAIKAAK